jgi:hypothetical protein
VRGGIGLVFFFVTGLGALPANHRIALGAEESGGEAGKVEAGGLAQNDDGGGVAILRQFVAEGQVVIGYAKGHGHLPSVGGGVGAREGVGVIIHGRGLGTVEGVGVLDFALGVGAQGHLLREVADVGHEAEGRILQNGFVAIGHRVHGATVLGIGCHAQQSVGTGHADGLCLGQEHGEKGKPG